MVIRNRENKALAIKGQGTQARWSLIEESDSGELDMGSSCSGVMSLSRCLRRELGGTDAFIVGTRGRIGKKCA